MKTTPTCATCPFWDNGNDQLFDGTGPQKNIVGPRSLYDNSGFCRAAPPKVDDYWPRTKRLDYCGQHPAFTMSDAAHRSAQTAIASAERSEKLKGEGQQE